jgi:hypothetical protein
MLGEISRKIQQAPYAAVMLDETFDIHKDPQLATVLRYIHDGKIQEDLLVSLTLVLTDFCMSRVMHRMYFKIKLVAEIRVYDGVRFMSGHFSVL